MKEYAFDGFLSQKFGGKPLTVASRQVEMNRI
jgi:hypothetical protein